jgi:hypothetical protein
MAQDYEYAPEHRIERIIQASADSGVAAAAGWERWRRESIGEGEWWYRRPIRGVEDEDDWISADADDDELGEVEALEQELDDRIQAARERLENLRAEHGDEFID